MSAELQAHGQGGHAGRWAGTEALSVGGAAGDAAEPAPTSPSPACPANWFPIFKGCMRQTTAQSASPEVQAMHRRAQAHVRSPAPPPSPPPKSTSASPVLRCQQPLEGRGRDAQRQRHTAREIGQRRVNRLYLLCIHRVLYPAEAGEADVENAGAESSGTGSCLRRRRCTRGTPAAAACRSTNQGSTSTLTHPIGITLPVWGCSTTRASQAASRATQADPT